MCPKSPKNVSHCIKYLEKTLKICYFFQRICISDFAKMGWKRGQLCLGCLEGFCFCFDVWIQCCHNKHSSLILQKSHQEQMSEHFLNLWWCWINLKMINYVSCKIWKHFSKSVVWRYYVNVLNQKSRSHFLMSTSGKLWQLP